MASQRVAGMRQATEPARGRNRGHIVPASGAPAGLQRQIGNRALQRLLAQRAGNGPTELDDETAARLERERGKGRSLDGDIGARVGLALGHDMEGVRVHTSPEADALSHQLGARAFTTGRDVFFRQGAYEPHTSEGRELIGHELVHVVQQGVGAVGGGAGRPQVNAPGDAFEREADTLSRALPLEPRAPHALQAQEEEEEPVQMQEEEEEEVQMRPDSGRGTRL
ncbi:MAG: eCIS core domain-containing protein [Anaerolineae bacterium]